MRWHVMIENGCDRFPSQHMKGLVNLPHQDVMKPKQVLDYLSVRIVNYIDVLAHEGSALAMT